MWSDGFGNARPLRGFAAGLPQHLGSDRLVSAQAVDRTRKQIRFRLHTAPVFSQRLKQFRTQWHSTILAILALADIDEHALTINIFDLAVAHLCSAHTGRVD